MTHGIWGNSVEVNLYEYYGEAQEYDPPEYHVCRHFGCGRKLSPQEMLFGDKCQSHSKNEKLFMKNMPATVHSGE